MKPSVARLCINAHEPISQALELLASSKEGICIVIGADERIVGTVTDGDCRRAILAGHSLKDPIEKAAHTQFLAVDSTFPLEQVHALMRTNAVRQIPIIDDQRRLLDLILHQTAAHAEQSAQVMILAGGKGTRLRPLTANVPKPMLHIGGKPMLAKLINSLVEEGFKDINISTSYLAERIESYFQDGSKWGCTINYLRETSELGTAGPLKLLPTQNSKPILVVNGDLVTKVDFSALIDFHRNSKFDLTIGASNHNIEVPFGVLDLDAKGKLRSICEKPVYSFPISAGIYVIEPKLLSLIPADSYCSMPDLFGRAIQEQFAIGAFPIHERWLDVGGPEQYMSAQEES